MMTIYCESHESVAEIKTRRASGRSESVRYLSVSVKLSLRVFTK